MRYYFDCGAAMAVLGGPKEVVSAHKKLCDMRGEPEKAWTLQKAYAINSGRQRATAEVICELYAIAYYLGRPYNIDSFFFASPEEGRHIVRCGNIYASVNASRAGEGRE